jgi:hypothetical protein
MKTYLIKIDKNSIKSNPNAGCTRYHVLSHSYGVLTIDGFIPITTATALEKEFDAKLTIAELAINNYYKDATFNIIHNGDPNDLLKLCAKYAIKPENVKIDITNTFDEINTLTPEGSHFFNYKNTKVKCIFCKSKFSYLELEDSLDYDHPVTNICPKCKEPFCCDIEYEKLKDVLKELNEHT